VRENKIEANQEKQLEYSVPQPVHIFPSVQACIQANAFDVTL
jgi:hypothetical protein